MKIATLFLALFLSISAQSATPMPPQGGVLQINPSVIEFKDFSPKTITVNNNYYLSKSEILSVELVIKKANGWLSNYSWMLQTSISDNGEITLNPYKLEIGTYTLIVNTKYGKVTAPVNAILVDPPVGDTSPGNPSDRYRTDIQLSENYYLGQSVVIPLSIPAGETYEWTVNGEVIYQTADAFIYLPNTSGLYNISLKATRNGVLVSSWSGQFNVIYEPSASLNYKVGQKVLFQAPENYLLRNCKINEVEINCAEQASFIQKFTEKGEYFVTLEVYSTLSSASMPFRVISYSVTIE